jgi:hypothetical protein
MTIIKVAILAPCPCFEILGKEWVDCRTTKGMVFTNTKKGKDESDIS